MINARAYSGSTTSGGSSDSGTGGEREGNDDKDQKQKDNNTDKQIGICSAGAGSLKWPT